MSRHEEKKKSIVFIIFGILLSIVLVAFTGALIYQIYKLQVLPDKILIPGILAIVLFGLILLLVLNFCTHGIISKIIYSFLVIAICIVYGFGNFYLYSTSKTLTTVTTQSNKAKNTVSVIAMNSSSMEDVKSLEGAKLGVLTNIGKESTEKSLKDIKKNKVTYTKSDYDNVPSLIKALYEGEVDAVVLNEAYRSNVCDIEEYANFNNETKVIHKTVYYTKENSSSLAVSDITSKPFNVLISGSDTRGGFDENGRSDVIMVATVNPKSHTILLTSVPRDFYVTTACDAGDGCMQGALDKITHTGIHGTNTTKRTVEQLLGIEINYTFKVGFDTVTKLVDTLGGVDVYVEPGYAVHNEYINVKEGVNHLYGEEALEYARERYAYAEGDRQRTKNQQQVLMGIVKEATKPSVITNYAAIMDTMANTFSTTMSNAEITDLIKYQLNNNPTWKMEQYMVDGTGDTLMCAELGDAASVMVPDQSTVKMAKDKINAVLAGKSSEDVK